MLQHLSRSGFQESAPRILELCDSANPGVQVAAIRAMGELERNSGGASGNGAQAPLKRFLKSRSAEVRRAAVVAGLPGDGPTAQSSQRDLSGAAVDGAQPRP